MIYEDEELKSRYPSLLMPPPSFVASGGNILAFKPGEGIRVAFPVRSDQSNPTGTLQSGILGNIFDGAFGRLAFASLRRPRVSIDVAVSFIRPVRPEGPW